LPEAISGPPKPLSIGALHVSVKAFTHAPELIAALPLESKTSQPY